MSNFSDVMRFLGLSHQEAAAALNVSEGDIFRWCNSNEAPPIQIWQHVLRMFDDIRHSAEEAAKSADIDHIDASDLNSIDLAVPGETAMEFDGAKRAARAMAVTALVRVFV